MAKRVKSETKMQIIESPRESDNISVFERTWTKMNAKFSFKKKEHLLLRLEKRQIFHHSGLFV